MAHAFETPSLHRFTVGEYYKMAETGILDPASRVELVFGVVREMSPMGNRHVVVTSRLRQRLDRALVNRAAVVEEKPLRLEALSSEPVPDITVYSNPDYESFGTAETEPLLVVEVSETTLAYDLSAKAELYAKGAIPDYWVLDLVHETLVVFRGPSNDGYNERREHSKGSRVAPTAWPDFEIEVASLFHSEAPNSP